MSRIGKLPIVIPSKVSVEVDKNNVVTVKGPKGELQQALTGGITAEVKDNHVYVSRPTDGKEHRSLHGLYRALIHNMVVGVSEGFRSVQELVGVVIVPVTMANYLNWLLVIHTKFTCFCRMR